MHTCIGTIEGWCRLQAGTHHPTHLHHQHEHGLSDGALDLGYGHFQGDDVTQLVEAHHLRVRGEKGGKATKKVD